MSRRRFGVWVHGALLVLVAVYSLFPIYFITVQSLKTPEEDVFGSPLYVVDPTFENYTELFAGAHARVRGFVIVPSPAYNTVFHRYLGMSVLRKTAM